MELQSNEVKQLFDQFLRHAGPEFLGYFEGKLRKLDEMVTDYEQQFKKVSDIKPDKDKAEEQVKSHKKFEEEVLAILQKEQKLIENGDFNSLFGDFIASAGKLVDQTEKSVVVREAFFGYAYRKTDGPVLWLRKGIVNAALGFKRLGKRIWNLFRPLFKKEKASLVHYRKRRIPLQDMTGHYLLLRFPEKALEDFAGINKFVSRCLQSLWKFDEDFANAFQGALKNEKSPDGQGDDEFRDPESFFNMLREENRQKQQEIREAIKHRATQVFLSFDEAVLKVGTLEHSSAKYGPEALRISQEEVNEDYATLSERWKNTHHTLMDDWAVDVEVIVLYYSVYDRYNHLKKEIDGFISRNLEKGFASIRSFIEKSSGRISETPANVKQVKEVIRAEREKVNKELIDSILTESIENLAHGFSDDFDELMAGTLELAAQISDKRGYVRSTSYDRGIRDSEINTISPRELLNIEALPSFSKNVTGVREKVNGRLEKARLALLTLGTVCDFNLESALMLMTQEKKGAKTAIETARQGYDRALFQLDNARSVISGIQKEVLDDLREAVNIFNEDVQKLKNTDSIFDLQMRIVKIRAVERSQRLRKQAAQYFKDIIPNIISFFKTSYAYSVDFLRRLKERTGMTQEKKDVSFELMEFINQVQAALKKLPYVYQRLYQIQPAEEERFFVNRSNELEMLNRCLENWKKGRYISCSVIGEKGSGTTSLINYFLLKYAKETPVIRQTLGEKIHSAEKYFAMFGELLEQKGIESNRQLIDHLNQMTDQRIIVMENLQHMFLKKVNGFQAMKMFFELISHTSKKVLWIGVFTPVSYKYLDQTLFISNYFSDEIRLEGLKDDTIREIIYKRNRLSGYQIQFVPGEERLQSKSYHKMDEESKQDYLEGLFFSKLNRVSNGNISLAQLHWLSSTLKVDEQHIFIGTIQNPDISFVKSLPGDKLFALQSLMLHDGLTLEDFAEVMKETEPYCRNLLVPMLEKGLLIRPKQKFNINPVIYRAVYEYLRSRNFIH